MSQTEPVIALTAQDLKGIIAETVKAAKAPNVIEQQKLDQEEKARELAQEQRKNLSESVLADKENKRVVQHICSHEHKSGDSHCVYIMEKVGPGYLLCQKNQCKIRPGAPPKNYKGDDIYDTDLFNRIFQKLPSNEMFG